MATIKEVAQSAGVSVATVSRVVNHSGYVSNDLRERVERSMQTLDYKPSALARSLRRQETHTVGLLIPQLNQPFFSTLISAIEKALFAGDYRALICSSEADAKKESAYIDILLRQRVDGVILVPTGDSVENVKRLLRANIPLVLIDRDLPELAINRVLTDNFTGAYLGAQHLLKLGHRCIALIGGPRRSPVLQERINGVRQAFRDYAVEFNPDLMRLGTSPEFEVGYELARELLRQPVPPTAIFALTDVIAVGVLHAAAELNLKVPEALSVIGFDDIPMAKFMIPALTTIAQPIYGMGETAVEILMRRLNDPERTPETIQLDDQLVIRKSTAAPVTSPPDPRLPA